MLAYSVLPVDDIAAATKFYDALFAELGIKQAMVARDGDFVAYGDGSGALFAVAVPVNGEAANPGNGNMVAVGVKDPETVATMYNKAISLGGTDEGAPGARADGAFHAGYFRDPFGNKVNFFFM